MSLVNEALKKARLEAARQDAARRGIPLPGAPRPTARAIRPAHLFRAGLVIAVIAAGVLLFYAGRRSTTTEIAATGVASTRPTQAVQTAGTPGPDPMAPPSSPQPSPPSPPAGRSPMDEAMPEGTPPSPEPRVKPEGAPPSPQPEGSRLSPESATGSTIQQSPPSPMEGVKGEGAPPSPEPEGSPLSPEPTRGSRVRTEWEPTTPTPTPTPAQAAVSEPPSPEPDVAAAPQSVLRRLELPGAIRIELGGIAWSEERPFALINGRVVGPGDVVEAMTVVGIQPRHVELRGQAGHYLLRIK